MANRPSAIRKPLALAMGAMLVAPAVAQAPGSPQTRNFVEAAGQSDTFEILEARMALAQSSDPNIRSFAQRMIEAHEETSRKLGQATTAAGLDPPPKGLSSDQSMLLSALQSQRGRDFDRTYAKHQVLAHSSALAVEQQYAKSGDQPAVRQAASSAVPVIASHLAMAQQLTAPFGDK